LFVTHEWTATCDEFLMLAGSQLRLCVCVFIFKTEGPEGMCKFYAARCRAQNVHFHKAPMAGYDFDGYIHALHSAAVRPPPLAPDAYTHYVFINSSVRAKRGTAVHELLDLLDSRWRDVGLVGASINAHFEYPGLEKKLHPHVQSGAFAFRGFMMPYMLRHNILSGPPLDRHKTIVRREIGMSDVVLAHANLNIADTTGMYAAVDFRRLYRRPLTLTHDPVSRTPIIGSIDSARPDVRAMYNRFLKDNRMTFVKAVLKSKVFNR
jgi:hypothetical protein